MSDLRTMATDLGYWMAVKWRWDVFATLTFRDPEPTPENAARGYTRVGTRGAERALLRWISGSVIVRAPGAYWWFVEEPHQYRTTPHFHGVIGGARSMRRDEVWAEWFGAWGMARLEPVDSAHAVAAYVSKYVCKGNGRMWTSRGLQSCAREPSYLGWLDWRADLEAESPSSCDADVESRGLFARSERNSDAILYKTKSPLESGSDAR